MLMWSRNLRCHHVTALHWEGWRMTDLFLILVWLIWYVLISKEKKYCGHNLGRGDRLAIKVVRDLKLETLLYVYAKSPCYLVQQSPTFLTHYHFRQTTILFKACQSFFYRIRWYLDGIFVGPSSSTRRVLLWFQSHQTRWYTDSIVNQVSPHELHIVTTS